MKPQIDFILKLRGVSALLVMLYHHCYFFWLHQDFCSKLANNQPVEDVPLVASFLNTLPINLGDLAVGSFFLISGFLMPLTAQWKTRYEFLNARIKRIWPPYVGALFLTLFWVYWNSQRNFRDFPWSSDHVLASLVFMRDIGGYPFIDGIVWTLEVEIKFYLLC
jgi:peptidoglycan/LPS O-acetylase OafA/YrhL